MARVELIDSWMTNIPSNEIWPRVHGFLTYYQVRVDRQTPYEVTGAHGSQVTTRFVGGWFTDASNYPKRISIYLQMVEGGTQVSVKIEETLGFGWLDSVMKKRYWDFFVWWAGALRAALPPV
ncbi:MAG TPA: hypothetical protein VHP83_11665 [Aggregatilineaceae bacterium]|nr:hypothetical protein [Aggregatilineaceae bacterium]